MCFKRTCSILIWQGRLQRFSSGSPRRHQKSCSRAKLSKSWSKRTTFRTNTRRRKSSSSASMSVATPVAKKFSMIRSWPSWNGSTQSSSSQTSHQTRRRLSRLPRFSRTYWARLRTSTHQLRALTSSLNSLRRCKTSACSTPSCHAFQTTQASLIVMRNRVTTVPWLILVAPS